MMNCAKGTVVPELVDQFNDIIDLKAQLLHEEIESFEQQKNATPRLMNLTPQAKQVLSDLLLSATNQELLNSTTHKQVYDNFEYDNDNLNIRPKEYFESENYSDSGIVYESGKHKRHQHQQPQQQQQRSPSSRKLTPGQRKLLINKVNEQYEKDQQSYQIDEIGSNNNNNNHNYNYNHHNNNGGGGSGGERCTNLRNKKVTWAKKADIVVLPSSPTADCFSFTNTVIATLVDHCDDDNDDDEDNYNYDYQQQQQQQHKFEPQKQSQQQQQQCQQQQQIQQQDTKTIKQQHEEKDKSKESTKSTQIPSKVEKPTTTHKPVIPHYNALLQKWADKYKHSFVVKTCLFNSTLSSTSTSASASATSTQCLCYCGKPFAFTDKHVQCMACMSRCHVNCTEQVPRPCIKFVDPYLRPSPNISNYVYPRSKPAVPALLVNCCREIEHKCMQALASDEPLTRSTVKPYYSKSEMLVPVREQCKQMLKQTRNGVQPLNQLSVETLCGIVKHFLSQICQPILNDSLWSEYSSFIHKQTDDSNKVALLKSISQMAAPVACTLCFMLLHLKHLANWIGQDLDILADIFCPILIGEKDAPRKLRLIKLLLAIDEQALLFAIERL